MRADMQTCVPCANRVTECTLCLHAGLRRCGSQGDILSGAIATFVAWVLTFLERQKEAGDSAGNLEVNPLILACFGGCVTTR